MERIIAKLPPIFAGIGLLGLLAAGALYFAGDQLSRLAVPIAAASLVLVIYYFVERPEGLIRLVTGRSARYGGNAFLMSVAFLAILGLLNVLGARYSYRADLTEAKQFTISPQTVKVLSGLTTTVKATAFVQAGTPTEEEVKTSLEQFMRYTKSLSVEYVDPVVRPGLAQQYGVEFAGTTVFEANGKRQQVVGSSEGELISGILKLTRGEPKKLYFVVGHGEPDPTSFEQAGFSLAKSQLEAENYSVNTLSLLSTGKVPDDAAVVVLAGPTSALQPAETQALIDYLDNGGKGLILADPERLVGLPELVARYGVEIKRGVVVEFQRSLQNEPLIPIIDSSGYQPSPITRSLPLLTLFPTATLVRPAEGGSEKYEVISLAQTTAQSYLETDPISGTAAPTIDVNKDIIGPITIAVSVSSFSPVGEGEGAKSTRLVVVGDVDFAKNAFLNYEGNRDFLANTVNWLAEDEDLMAVRAKDSVNRRLILSSGQTSLILYSTVFALPLLVLGVGLWVYWGRR